jgi:chromosome segregation ATPase
MREFLKGLDLDKETIDTIMAEHGKLITEAKEQISELTDKVKDYESKFEENSKSLENLQSLTNENKDLKAEIQMNGSDVKKEFSKFVRSEVMSQVNDENDFASVLESYKKENPQYFGETVVKKVQSSPSLANGGTQPQTTNDIMNNLLRGESKN